MKIIKNDIILYSQEFDDYSYLEQSHAEFLATNDKSMPHYMLESAILAIGLFLISQIIAELRSQEKQIEDDMRQDELRKMLKAYDEKISKIQNDLNQLNDEEKSGLAILEMVESNEIKIELDTKLEKELILKIEELKEHHIDDENT